MIRKSIVLLTIILIVTLSCKKTESLKTNIKKHVIEKEIPFIGTWSRGFSMGKGVKANVTYSIYQDSILYTMNGPMKMTYTIKKDTFVAKENKWIGNKNGVPYILFIKNKTKDAITLLKMKLNSKEQGLKMPFPSDTARSKFSSWNVYDKK